VAPVLGLVCFLGAPVVLPLVASASVVTVPETSSAGDEVRYVAAAGERNTLHVRHDYDEASGSSWIFSDAGAFISPGRSCMAIDEHTVKCGARGARHAKRALQNATVRLADLDDELRFTEAAPTELSIPPPPALPPLPAESGFLDAYGGDGDDQLFAGGGDSLNFVEGGAGNDQLFGAANSDVLDGGSGDDRLIAGPGEDDLDGGGGSDQLFGGGGPDTLTDGDRDGGQDGSVPGPDVLDGGAGAEDRISYKQRKTAVTVDLADTHPEGALGEGDTVSGIESIVGGRGDDRLAGDHGRNSLAGGPGSDQLRGRGGRDFIFAGGGDLVWCGRGADLVLSLAAHAFLHRDCERVMSGATPSMTPYPRTIAPDHIAYRVPCFERRPRCGRTVRLTEASGKGRLLARGTVARGHVARIVDVVLTRLGRRLALREHGVRAIVRVIITQWGHSKVTWTIRLKVRG